MKFHDTIDKPVQRVITNSHIMFIASAPVNGKHVNLSPKGMNGTFKVTGPNEVQYLDTFGSGCETLAHIRENGRVTLMFCTFQGDPLIVRIFGTGSAALNGTAEFDEKVANFGDTALDKSAFRSVITIKSFTITSSCGYAVPLMTFEQDRRVLSDNHTARPPGKLTNAPDYNEKYAIRGYSLDGLPGAGVEMGKEGAYWRPARPLSTITGWFTQNYQGILVGSLLATLVSRQMRSQ